MQQKILQPKSGHTSSKIAEGIETTQSDIGVAYRETTIHTFKLHY